MKRVDDEIFGVRQAPSGPAPHEKMTGEIDAFHMKSGAPRDLHVQERQRDRDAGPPVENLVQEAVARIFVPDFVAHEPELFEQVVVEGHHSGVAVGIDTRRRLAGQDRGRRHAELRFLTNRIQPIEVRSRVELGVLDARDHQRRDREIGIGAECGVREAADQLLLHHGTIGDLAERA